MDIKRTIVLKGIAVSPGIAFGKVYILDRSEVQAPLYNVDHPAQIVSEIKRFREALKKSREELLEIKKSLSEREIEPSFILDVHILMLRDKTLLNTSIENIREKKINAEWALKLTLNKYREMFSKIEDSYLKERISDVEYVSQRILRNLVGAKSKSIAEIEERVLIVSRDLSPADTVQMKMDRIMGFATDMGGKTSHTAIIARSLGIPAVVGLERITREVRNNDEIIIDGCDGFIIVNPDPEVLIRYEEKKRHFEILEEDLLREAHLPAVTLDGCKIGIGANIEFVEEIPTALAHGAEGIGLYRTEFIYINRDRLPTEEEHFFNYRKIIEGTNLKWSTIRTFDLGGDKFISDPRVADELNPVMGLRAIRFCLQEIELFKVQLRAILRASAYGKTRILFPMISSLEEIQKVKSILAEVKLQLARENIPTGSIELGIMIEVPSAVIIADSLAREVDFFSIGTNDLIQYTLAIDRVNERVSYLYDPLHPAVLRLIRMIVESAHDAGIRVAICGEMAGEPAFTLMLLGLGLDELSMNPLAIPRVKKIIRNSTLEEAKALLKESMKYDTASKTEDFVRGYMNNRFPDEFYFEKA